MILEIDEHALATTFFSLMGEVEYGDRFDLDNPSHRGWLTERISRYYLRGIRFFALFQNEDTPVGFTSVDMDPKLDGVPYIGQYSEIMAIGVLPQYRRGGYGSQLLEYSEQFAREHGAYCLYVATYAGAHHTIAFYGKNGYVPMATLPGVYGPAAEGRLYMRKLLRK